jgi:ribosomal protein S18 acetylase RimI-like enzyme
MIFFLFFNILSYPDSWFDDITSNKKFYSIAATYNDRIIGILVAEVKLKKITDREDYQLLSNKHHEDTHITYILSIGVIEECRRLGIASLLLDSLIDYLKSETDCKAIYLHVLCTNTQAIHFYEKRNFRRRIFLPKYYTIQGQFQDGYCYVMYMNNGQPPRTLYPFYLLLFYFLICLNILVVSILFALNFYF